MFRDSRVVLFLLVVVIGTSLAHHNRQNNSMYPIDFYVNAPFPFNPLPDPFAASQYPPPLFTNSGQTHSQETESFRSASQSKSIPSEAIYVPGPPPLIPLPPFLVPNLFKLESDQYHGKVQPTKQRHSNGGISHVYPFLVGPPIPPYGAVSHASVDGRTAYHQTGHQGNHYLNSGYIAENGPVVTRIQNGETETSSIGSYHKPQGNQSI